MGALSASGSSKGKACDRAVGAEQTAAGGPLLDGQDDQFDGTRQVHATVNARRPCPPMRQRGWSIRGGFEAEPRAVPGDEACGLAALGKAHVGERDHVLVPVARPASRGEPPTRVAVVGDLDHGDGLIDHRGAGGKLDVVRERLAEGVQSLTIGTGIDRRGRHWFLLLVAVHHFAGRRRSRTRRLPPSGGP